MSEENRIPTEQELWDVLTEPVVTSTKPEPVKKSRPKSGPRFASEAPIRDVPAAPVKRKPDAVFLACMAGVAAVSVAATLMISGMTGGKIPAGELPTEPAATESAAVSDTVSVQSSDPDRLAQLEQENEQLREQLELQKQQISTLQAQLMDLTGDKIKLPNSADSSGETDPQVEAYDIFNQIRDAYADFNRDKLEQLIPEMDKRLSHLSSDALTEYYMILEYVEQPSNG